MRRTMGVYALWNPARTDDHHQIINYEEIMKVLETNLPEEVINAIDKHLKLAESKHQVFAFSILPERLNDNELIRKSLKEARLNCNSTGSAYDVLQEEILEIFDAICDGDLYNARTEIYDSIAVLLRLDKVLQEKQRNLYFQKNDIPILPKCTTEI